MSLIRTYTYLKYVRINLQEAGAALEEGLPKRCAAKVSYASTTLIKAVAAALPMVKKDFFEMTDRELLRHISDLSDKEDTAVQIMSHLSLARTACQTEPVELQEAEAALSAAGQAFSLLHDLFRTYS